MGEDYTLPAPTRITAIVKVQLFEVFLPPETVLLTAACFREKHHITNVSLIILVINTDTNLMKYKTWI